MVLKNYREQSRINWSRELEEGKKMNNEDLTFGCLLRIADATESMAKNHITMQNELKWANQTIDRLRSEKRRLELSAISLRGVITKKNKIIAALK